MKTLNEWLAYCEQLHPQAIDMGLGRVQNVADRMALNIKVPVITVVGTNGKGSTCAMLESILMQAGYRTGVYTSPHLVHFEERLRLNGEAVKAPELVAAMIGRDAELGALQAAFKRLFVNAPKGVFKMLEKVKKA